MPREGRPWVFRQLAGAKKTLRLEGAAAPHGSVRREPIVRTGKTVRAERTRYPATPIPVRHVFSTAHPDWELQGRWRDRDFGRQGARAKVAEVEAFVGDAQPVEIAWGDILIYEGFIRELEVGWEAETEVTWILRIEIDKRQGSIRPAPRRPKPIQDRTRAVVEALTQVRRDVKRPSLPQSPFDLLSRVVGSLTGLVGQFQDAASKIQDAKAATFEELSRATQAAGQVRRVALAVRGTFATIPAEALLLGQRAEEQIKLFDAQVSAEEQILAMADAAAEVEGAATRARVERALTSYVARAGDTWEAISMQFYRTPDRADELREANGVAAGQGPIPGERYFIPR
jgi:hypothetical protein